MQTEEKINYINQIYKGWLRMQYWKDSKPMVLFQGPSMPPSLARNRLLQSGCNSGGSCDWITQGGFKKNHNFFNRIFHHFAGNFLLFLVIDFSQLGLRVILPPSFSSQVEQFWLYEPKLNQNPGFGSSENINNWLIRPNKI